MIPRCFGIHYPEDDLKDDVVIFFADEEISNKAIHLRFEELKELHLPNADDFGSRDEMIETIFDALADEFDGEWSGCDVLFHLNVV